MIGPGLPVLDRVAIYWPTCANTAVFESCHANCRVAAYWITCINTMVFEHKWPRERRHGLFLVNTATKECAARFRLRSEEHTSELQSLMRISYAVFCLK